MSDLVHRSRLPHHHVIGRKCPVFACPWYQHIEDRESRMERESEERFRTRFEYLPERRPANEEE